uniref:Transposase n=1 Tax=Steinernema glaseri TaxID=37863 RepID=A0A1I8AKE1_9BILA
MPKEITQELAPLMNSSLKRSSFLVRASYRINRYRSFQGILCALFYVLSIIPIQNGLIRQSKCPATS